MVFFREKKKTAVEMVANEQWKLFEKTGRALEVVEKTVTAPASKKFKTSAATAPAVVQLLVSETDCI